MNNEFSKLFQVLETFVEIEDIEVGVLIKAGNLVFDNNVFVGNRWQDANYCIVSVIYG